MQKAYLVLEVNPCFIEKVTKVINTCSNVLHCDIIEGNTQIIVLVGGESKYELAEAVNHILLVEDEHIDDSSVFPIRSETQTVLTGMLTLF